MNLKFLTAAAVLSTALAAPALAQDSHGRSDAVRQTPQSQERMYQRQSGFWPADAAAGIVGGAIGTRARSQPRRSETMSTPTTTATMAKPMAAITTASSVSPEPRSSART